MVSMLLDRALFCSWLPQIRRRKRESFWPPSQVLAGALNSDSGNIAWNISSRVVPQIYTHAVSWPMDVYIYIYLECRLSRYLCTCIVCTTPYVVLRRNQIPSKMSVSTKTGMYIWYIAVCIYICGTTVVIVLLI